MIFSSCRENRPTVAPFGGNTILQALFGILQYYLRYGLFFIVFLCLYSEGFKTQFLSFRFHFFLLVWKMPTT